MSSIIMVIICISGLLTTINLAQAQGWRGIVPLHSTREDVERLIGSPIEPNGITYDLKTERVNVVYSDGHCVEGQSGWNVPSGTVIGITIYPQTKLTLSDLHFDLNRFEKFINPHNPDSVYYNNEEDGISIGTRSNGEVIVIYYLPAAKDDHLRCPGSSAPQISNYEMKYYKFDEYSNLSFNDEKARLDNSAIYLQQESRMRGYIIAYTGRHTRNGEATVRANRAKSYLVNERGIEAKRIVIINGGYRETSTVELYILPPNAPMPTPVPTIKPSKVQLSKSSKTKGC